MELRELISGDVEQVPPNTTVADAATQMWNSGVGALAVVDEGTFSGIFTERDVLHFVAEDGDPSTETVAGWMTLYPDSFSPDLAVREAADWMLAAGYRHLPVMDGERLVGVASIKDVLWALTGDSEG